MGYVLVVDADIKGRNEKYFESRKEAMDTWQRARASGRVYSATLWDTTNACVKIADYDRGLGESMQRY